jgi:glyoxylase I family protein
MNAATTRPRILGVDHISWTVPDLDAAIAFYEEAFGATVLYRMGPFDGADIPPDAAGNDWMETHVGVKGACLSIAMLQLAPNLKFQMVQYDKPADRRQDVPRNCDRGGHHIGILVEDVDATCAWLAARGCKVLQTIAMDAGPLAGKKNVYVQDPWGHQLEIVD